MNSPPRGAPNQGASTSKAPHPPSDTVEDVHPHVDESRGAELARLQTVNFLSRLTKDGYARQYRKRVTEDLCEKCYFSCSQGIAVVQAECSSTIPIYSKFTDIDKRVRREPDCTVWCYVRTTEKGAQRKRSLAPKTEPNFWRPNGSGNSARDKDETKYRFESLEDRYLYKARGRMAIAKHAEETPTIEALDELEKTTAKQPPPPSSNIAAKLAMLSRHQFIPVPSYEQVHPLDTAVSSRLLRFEKHLIRIYSPTWNALQRMPSLYADGTVKRTVNQLYESVTNGDGIALGQKLLGVGYDTIRKWIESSNTGGGDENGGPPSLFPRNPRRNGDTDRKDDPGQS